ncbi:single-stranded-DNA-specific exonuclease RecJ [Hyphomicrobium sp.]|uniref:single-stranded-DNA-specific exonuclease RecJ n=1 Tax=Hyphomicrobium sp. TaxID=82 RepID=UPI002C56BE24|nr:single-stranded-DNA-specific exonuclease RecJ [Hyphomicrobium sp.]HRN87340.1 single-stranded-DNA-specific exonuclease RecJ [Hyphomicrobium sp.]HRQ26327.1 single-stranded-DNA-specific exonuclease RecJ [Hyphomicrobium sp.]
MTALRKARATPVAESDEAAFLSVTQSARGNRWRETLEPQRANEALAISQQHGLPELLGRVLAARGVRLDEVPVFLDPTIRALMPDPSSLTDMDKAARRLADAVERREPVAIFGDYDVDGAASSALVARFLAHHDVPARIYIPDRLTEGYGPNAAAIDQLIGEGAKLIVTVDCGTTSVDVLDGATARGVDVLVVDHHQADERLPAVHALVNPNRLDDISGQGHLCAAGVVFLVLVATARELRQRGFYGAKMGEPPLMSELDLVALATVADVVPLKGLNRAYVTKGLQVMRARDNVGLRALQDAAGLGEAPSAYHLGFILGPRINAGGRIGDAGLGARLLSTEDAGEAARIAALLDRLNKERKEIEQSALEEATSMADRMLDETPDLGILIVGSPEWHRGVVGLIASRLTERFKRPSCVISWDEAARGGGMNGTGSLRSVAGIDIGGAVRRAVAAGLLLKGGGHAMAAGLTVEKEKLAALQDFFASELSGAAVQLAARASLSVDGALVPSAVNEALIDLLERAGPYGQGNPQPRFVFPAHRVKFAKPVGTAHIRCVLEAGDGSRLDAVAFRAAGQPLGELLMASAGGLPVHVAGQLRRDTWGGRNRIELQIEDAADPRAQEG